MTEEEKKAIEYLKDYIKSDLNYFTIDFNNNLRISMNLIEKLQKENEELKEKNDNNNVYKDLQEDLTSLLKKEFIPKDKIKIKFKSIINHFEKMGITNEDISYLKLKEQELLKEE